MDNTEGSRVITRVFRARKKIELRLSDRQMSIVLGSIIGDAYIYPLGKICFEHSDAQKNYLFWKYAELNDLAYTKISRMVRIDHRNGKANISWRFFLRQFFRPLRSAFYQNNKKRIPSDLIFWMNPLFLAIWYMDDGHLDRRKYPVLMTESFPISDNNYLIASLKNKFGIYSHLTQKNRIWIDKRSQRNFFRLIEPYIHETLKYKLP